MKEGKLLLTALLVLVLAGSAIAQKQDAPGPERYVIVGVFRVLDNAVRYTKKANEANFQAGYIQNPRNKLYYVYLFQSLESPKAFAFMMKVRLETEYKEAWVYRGSLGVPIQPTTVENTPVVTPIEQPKDQPKDEPKDVTPQQPVEAPKDSAATDPNVPVETDPIVTPPVETPKDNPATVTPKVDSAAATVTTPPNTTTKLDPKPIGKPFFFKLISNETGEPLVGEIHVFEPNQDASHYQAFPSNQVVYLPAPRDPSQVYGISTLSAGYQEMTRSINYTDPSTSAAELGSSNEFVIALPLIHVKMGDYIEFSRVTFFPNSVMLHIESKEELDGLAELLKQNPRYKINVHAHCNGDQDRNIVVRGHSAEFFGNSTGNQRRTVSAKEFTTLRAELVKEYLVSQGIEAKRIDTKGEGGKALIYPTNSTLAGRNDRVEIEVKRGK